MHINYATSVQSDIGSIVGMSSGRLGASAAAMIGLIGVVCGGFALASSRGRRRSTGQTDAPNGRRTVRLALALGLISAALGGLFAVTADGGVGTGNGQGGAIVAVLLGLTAVCLGGLARARQPQAA